MTDESADETPDCDGPNYGYRKRYKAALFCFRWFCHFDDDNYVNVPRLVRFLGDYNPREDWYLGKPSIQAPLEIVNKDKTSVSGALGSKKGDSAFCERWN